MMESGSGMGGGLETHSGAAIIISTPLRRDKHKHVCVCVFGPIGFHFTQAHINT